MRSPQFYAAVFVIINDDEWRILFQKRQNTWFRDGQFQLPSWHIEIAESIHNAIIREMEEELGIEIWENDIDIVHIAHTLTGDRTYFNIYASIKSYTWEIQNLESDKCSELGFYNFEDIKTHSDFLYEVETLKKIYGWKIFSEKVVS